MLSAQIQRHDLFHQVPTSCHCRMFSPFPPLIARCANNKLVASIMMLKRIRLGSPAKRSFWEFNLSASSPSGVQLVRLMSFCVPPNFVLDSSPR